MVNLRRLKNKIKFSIPPRKYVFASVALTSRFPIGTHVMDEDWDVLVVLDTCRTDAMQDVASEYSFIDEVDRIWSRGAHSVEWMSHTFDRKWEKELSSTALISANPFAKVVLDQDLQDTERDAANRLRKLGDWDLITSEDLGHVEYVWQYDTDTPAVRELKEKEYLPKHVTFPKPVTDRGIDTWRNRDGIDRMILHYWQPHKPFIANAIEEKRPLRDYEYKFFEYLKDTDDWETVYSTFLDELRFALDSVKVLLRNIDAEDVVITADHGEAMGEFGDYNHQMGLLNPYVRFVPWVETSATDRRTRDPDTELTEREGYSVDERLSALGYK